MIEQRTVPRTDSKDTFTSTQLETDTETDSVLPITERRILMKKVCWLAIFLIVLSLFCFPTASASGAEKDMVYVADDYRESIYLATQNESFDYYLALKEDDLQIVKESITPVYTIDVLDYAKTNNFLLKPLQSGKTDNAGDQGNVYVAKTLLSDNTYGGNIMFYIENGVARFMTFSPSGALKKYFTNGVNPRFRASSSYADHATRIKQILKREEFVSPNDVRFVFIDDIGQFFYVCTDGYQYFIPIGYQNTDDSYEVDVALTISDMKKLAQKQLEVYNKRMALKEAWEKEHPGEVCDLVGYEQAAPVLSGCGHVDNILNIPEYLGINMNVNQQDAPSNYPQIWIWTIIAICAIAFGCIIAVKLKKQKNSAR